MIFYDSSWLNQPCNIILYCSLELSSSLGFYRIISEPGSLDLLDSYSETPHTVCVCAHVHMHTSVHACHGWKHYCKSFSKNPFSNVSHWISCFMCFKMRDFVVLRTQRFQRRPNQLVCCMSKQWYLFLQAKITLFKVLCDKVHNYDPNILSSSANALSDETVKPN